MMFGAVAASAVLFKPSSFEWDSRDTVNDGGFVANGFLDRRSGLSASAVTANKLIRDTTLLGGTPVIKSDGAANDACLRCVSSGTFGGISGTASYSIVMRVYRYGTSGIFCAFGDGGVGTLNTISHLCVSTNVTRAQRIGPASTTNTDYTAAINTGQWYTLGWSYNGSTGVYTHYRDGVLVATHAANTQAPSAVTTFTMGNADANSTSGRQAYAGWKGWIGQTIDAAQHLYEHNLYDVWT